MSATSSHGDRPGERKARLLLETLRDRWADVLPFTEDLSVPATSNQAERDLRPRGEVRAADTYLADVAHRSGNFDYV